MVERVMSYVPVLSIAALAFVSIFNIGYFYPIGIHFIGVMDITNLVYSFALVFGVLVAVLQFLSSDIIDHIAKFRNDEEALKKYRRRTLRYMVPLIALGLVSVGLIPERYSTIALVEAITALFFAVLTLWALTLTLILTKHLGRTDVGSVISVVFCLVMTIGYTGRSIGRIQAFHTPNTYEMLTKDGVSREVRLVRVSSNGFLISYGQRVMFYPKDEVRRIASKEVKTR